MNLLEVNPDDIFTPFEVKRVYWVWGVAEGEVRGRHAYAELEELVIAVNGACTMTVDDGSNRVSHRLDSPRKGLFLGKLIWREMCDYTADCVLLVLASAQYDPEDYILEYNAFQRLVAQS